MREGGAPVRSDLLVFGQPDVRREDLQAVEDVLKSGWIGPGPKTEEFEEKIKTFVGAEHAVGLSSCSAALDLALRCSGIGPGDEVITTPMTFTATAHAIIHAGARPVFVDCDADTQTISCDKIRKAVGLKTKAILPVHFAGYPCDMDAIMALARERQLLVMEDGAHALGASVQAGKIGALSNGTAFSFSPTKNVTSASGGMFTTNNGALAEKVRAYANHGISKNTWERFREGGHGETLVPGFNVMMTDLQAALGLAQCGRMAEIRTKRLALWEYYTMHLQGMPLALPRMDVPHGEHALHLFTIHLDLERLTVSRDKIREALRREGIGTGVHYTALHLQPYYKKEFRFKMGQFPCAEWISERTLSLPFSSAMKESDAEDVVSALKKVLERFSKG